MNIALTLIDKGGPVMYFLLACSFVAVALIFERLLFWFVLKRRLNMEEVDTLFEHLRHGRVKDLFKMRKHTQNPVILALTHALRHGDKALHDALDIEVDKEFEKSRAFLSGIETVVTLSPLLGIFGTVTGIINSFDLLGGMVIADPRLVSGGIGEALITTAFGLAIAMPSLIFYNIFRSMSDRYILRLEKYAREFDLLYAQLKKEDHYYDHDSLSSKKDHL